VITLTVDEALRNECILRGLQAPQDDLCGCGDAHQLHRTKGPSVNDLLFASRKHRNPAMAKVHRDFFKALMDRTTKAEVEMLHVLGLPSIEEVRRAIVTGSQPESGQPFQYHDTMYLRLLAVVKDWLEDILSPEYAVTGKGLTDGIDWTTIKWIVIRFMAMAFNVEARDQYDKMRDIAGENAILTMVMADPNRDYFKAMIAEGGKRITTEIAVNRLNKVRDMLIDMSYNGRWPIEVGRKLHDIIGEGAAWYWQRIARSEATLAAGLAFDKMAAENGTNFEEWSAGTGCCIICAWLDGKVWRRGEGPHPVSDTHPHCMCARIATYTRGGTHGRLEPRYDRPSPYKSDPNGRPWTKEEIDKMREELQPTRGGTFPLPPGGQP